MLRVLIRSRGKRDIQLYYVDPDTGREVSRTSGTRDKGEAERAAERWQQELVNYRGAQGNGWEFFRDRFRDEHLATLSLRAVASYKTALNHYWRLMKPATLDDLTAASVSQFAAKLMGEKRPLSSVRNYLTHLRAALRWAQHVGLMREAPAIRMPKQSQRVFMRSRPVTLPEFKRMLRACKDKSLRRLMRLIWLSGMRLSEALLASWDIPPVQVDIDAKPYPQILYYAEGHKARRDDAVPMTPELFAWLSRTRERRSLVAPVGTSWQRQVSEQIAAVARAAEVFTAPGKPAGAHDLRRAFATSMARRVMPTTLQKLTRHSDLSTVLRFYVSVAGSDVGAELWQHRGKFPGTK